jgi:hypothetical protein
MNLSKIVFLTPVISILGAVVVYHAGLPKSEPLNYDLAPVASVEAPVAAPEPLLDSPAATTGVGTRTAPNGNGAARRAAPKPVVLEKVRSNAWGTMYVNPSRGSTRGPGVHHTVDMNTARLNTY